MRVKVICCHLLVWITNAKLKQNKIHLMECCLLVCMHNTPNPFPSFTASQKVQNLAGDRISCHEGQWWRRAVWQKNVTPTLKKVLQLMLWPFTFGEHLKSFQCNRERPRPTSQSGLTFYWQNVNAEEKTLDQDRRSPPLLDLCNILLLRIFTR